MDAYVPGTPAVGDGSDIVLDGGPLDGRQESVAADADELNVVMTDGQQHRYVRTGSARRLPDGRPVQVFAWTGRYYGPTPRSTH